MKTTLELPDPLLRKAKAAAAARGQSLKDFVTEALCEKLATSNRVAASSQEPDWMQGFGKLRHLRKETARVQAVIDDEIDVIEPEDRG
jgi:hypothetical protein